MTHKRGIQYLKDSHYCDCCGSILMNKALSNDDIQLCQTCHDRQVICSHCNAKLTRMYMEGEIHSTIIDMCETGYHCRCSQCRRTYRRQDASTCVSCGDTVRIELCQDPEDCIVDLCHRCIGFCLSCQSTRSSLIRPSTSCDICTDVHRILNIHLPFVLAQLVLAFIGDNIYAPAELSIACINVYRGRQRLPSILSTIRDTKRTKKKYCAYDWSNAEPVIHSTVQ